MYGLMSQRTGDRLAGISLGIGAASCIHMDITELFPEGINLDESEAKAVQNKTRRTYYSAAHGAKVLKLLAAWKQSGGAMIRIDPRKLNMTQHTLRQMIYDALHWLRDNQSTNSLMREYPNITVKMHQNGTVWMERGEAAQVSAPVSDNILDAIVSTGMAPGANPVQLVKEFVDTCIRDKAEAGTELTLEHGGLDSVVSAACQKLVARHGNKFMYVEDAERSRVIYFGDLA